MLKRFTSPYSAKRNVNVPAVNFGVREEGKRRRDESGARSWSGSDVERLRTNLIAANRAGWPNYRPGIR